MSVSIYKIKKWYKMLTGQSISHVKQDIGTCYSKTEVAGYYNDLTEKITRDDPDILIPKYFVDSGAEIFFSIGIFQYGLANITFSKGIQLIDSVEASLLLTIEPVFNPIPVAIICGEHMGVLAIAGSAVVIISVALYSLLPRLRKTA